VSNHGKTIDEKKHLSLTAIGSNYAIQVPMTYDSNFSNLELLEDLYSQYKKDPCSIDSTWQSIFHNLENDSEPFFQPSENYAKIAQNSPSDLRIYYLIQAYRTFGHFLANINPIATQPVQEPWQLKLETLGFTPQELTASFPTCGLMPSETATLQEIIDTLYSIYCNKIGIEYMQLENPKIASWLQERIEPNHFQVKLSIEQKQMILNQLNCSELLETFIHMKYTGQKRFSLEGSETLIPMLEAIIDTGNKLELEDFVIGMAHRGRLNVLNNILNKSHADIFSEFEEGYIPNSFEGSGDVKYHKGFFSEITTSEGKKVRITLPPNPSHLEAIDPVVEGIVRAKQCKMPENGSNKCLPILIHGDAAIAGQGVVYETLQFYNLPGYSTGGTIHIVINNQVGFTAAPEETRSTRYCTDIAKTFNAPVFHVNAEDPEACVYVTNLAVQIRQTFHCDVFIDLNCYRKYGHNESDEPAFTQPLEYQLIRKKPPIREIYRDQLVHEGVMEKHIAESLEQKFIDGLQKTQQEIKEAIKSTPNHVSKNTSTIKPISQSFQTNIPKSLLQEIATKMSVIPEGFNIHPKLKTLLADRLRMVQEGENGKSIDWGMAETLAYASLLWNGTSIRLSGQDCGRGTFSHRHAIWMDQKIEKAYSPLNHLKESQGLFEVYNSSLSEYAVLGFEFGYSVGAPKDLVIWEAQFGDFANGAQIMIDQFISTSEKKWNQLSGLTMLLPHGYEGQGPEHSSGRLERFLILSAEDNMRVVNPTTPAQIYHLLRQQALNPIKKPLIVFTPKGLLRHPDCISTIDELAQGSFQDIIDDSMIDSKNIKKVFFVTGRIYYDLIAERNKRKNLQIAIVRIEQLYPLNMENIKEIIKKYAVAEEFVWVQDEPSNMGAWGFIQPQLQELLPKEKELKYIGRKRSASPAAGSYVMHKKQHAEIIEGVFGT
jgi:2-oxoglutarate dehydrogenase E1 component